jgi:hypothetical protein
MKIKDEEGKVGWLDKKNAKNCIEIMCGKIESIK